MAKKLFSKGTIKKLAPLALIGGAVYLHSKKHPGGKGASSMANAATSGPGHQPSSVGQTAMYTMNPGSPGYQTNVGSGYAG